MYLFKTNKPEVEETPVYSRKYIFTWSTVAPRYLCVRGVSVSPTARWLADGAWPRPCWRTHLMRLALRDSERNIVFLEEEYCVSEEYSRWLDVWENESPAEMKQRVSVVLLLFTLSGESTTSSQCFHASLFVWHLFIYVQEISVWYIITNNTVTCRHW